MKKRQWILAVILGLWSASVFGQEIERVVQRILNGQMLNASVTVYGVVSHWELDPASNTVSYVLRDDWNDLVTVVSEGAHPETNRRYRVRGFVAFEASNRIYQIMETERILLDVPPTPVIILPPTPVPEPVQPTPIPEPEKVEGEVDIYLLILIACVVMVLVVLIALLLRYRAASKAEIDSSSLITVVDKTQKITASVPTDKAIQQGTVKVMPGRFEVEGGQEIKEIRLFRPRGLADHNLKYTFGRREGDPISHIRLNEPTVSSRQAEMLFRDGKYVFVNIPDPSDPDRNASIINGRRMTAQESCVLNEGDVIEMGHVKLIYHD